MGKGKKFNKSHKQENVINLDKVTKSLKMKKIFVEERKDQNINDRDLKRLNCEIPKQLHTWLNVYARSNSSGYRTMTEIVIKVLDEFAKERGFKVTK